METKHTPTPWAVTGASFGEEYYVRINSEHPNVGPQYSRVAGVFFDSPNCPPKREEAEANAAFIVKAVNNFDNLVEALEWMISYGPATDQPENREALSFAGAVLAKAKES